MNEKTNDELPEGLAVFSGGNLPDNVVGRNEINRINYDKEERTLDFYMGYDKKNDPSYHLKINENDWLETAIHLCEKVWFQAYHISLILRFCKIYFVDKKKKFPKTKFSTIYRADYYKSHDKQVQVIPWEDETEVSLTY